ncbi:hypothetical protein DXG01_002807 [Tephrocybe rancida]|nr:hypothetical protein DXG01_002807 [Tephrocybe rancida]
MLRADNDSTAPDGKKPSVPKCLFDRLKGFKSTKSDSPSINPMEDRAAPGASDGKRAFPNRLFDRVRGHSKFTMSSCAPGSPATHSIENLAGKGTSSLFHVVIKAHWLTQHPVLLLNSRLKFSTPGVGTPPVASGAAASAQIVTGPTLAINVDQGNPMTPAGIHTSFTARRVLMPTQPRVLRRRPKSIEAAPQPQPTLTVYTATGPASAMNIDRNLVVSQNTPAMNPGSVSLMNINTSVLPGPDVPQEQSKFKEGVNVALDGCLMALRVAKEASEWNPFLKAALGGIVAVIDLAKTVSGNLQDMKDILGHIQGLLPILETSAKRLEGHKDGFGKENNLINFVITMQTELKKIQQMQSHGHFRHILQGTPDADTLQGIYKNISKALEQFKV